MLALAGFAALAAANLYFGELNQDEGWYLYAARLVSEGQLPYRDFAFTQGPLLPLAYSLIQPLVEWGGLAVGRSFTALLGLAAALLASALASRLAPARSRSWAALLTFGLVALNVYQSYFTTVVKTYALCGLFLTLGFLLLAIARERRNASWYALAGLAFAAAAGTRITAGLALPVAGLYLLASRRSLGDRGWLSFGVGGAAGLALLYGTLYAMAPEAFRFFVVDYHSARSAGGALGGLVYKVGFASRLIQAYFVALAGAAALALARLQGRGTPRPARDGLQLAGWATLAGITLVHAMAPFPYDDYQVPLFPLFGALLATAASRLLGEERVGGAPGRLLMLAVLLASLAASVSSPINQNWMILGRDRIWWRMRPQAALPQLQQAAARVRQLAGDSPELLTQDTYLAVESGLRVPRGLELGVFSYYPDFDRARAERLHVVNGAMLQEIIARTPARAAALSEYSFVVAAPAVRKLSDEEQSAWWYHVASRFEPAGEVPDFGQGSTRLGLFTRPADAAP